MKNTTSPHPIVYAPKDFAAVFGKSQSWAYRMIYHGKVRTIQGFGEIRIPASEVHRILASASEDYQPQSNRGRKPARD
jgi:hypothetical protein